MFAEYRKSGKMKWNSIMVIFVSVLCISTLLVSSAIAGPQDGPLVSVPEPAGILAFLGAAVAGIAAIRSRLKK
jgi:hypothetical protein